MEVITRGDLELTPLDLGDGISIAVRAPGIHIAWRSVDAAPAIATFAAVADGAGTGADDWSKAIADNGLTHFKSVEAQPLAVEMVRTMTLAMPESEDVFAETRVTPPAGQGLLAMVESDGVVQWYLPTNVPPVVADAGPFVGPVAIGEPAEIAGAAAVNVGSAFPAELRFMIPRSTLTRDSTSVAALGVAAGIGGAIIHFFRFDIVNELLGAAMETIVAWIAGHVDTKREGFRWFDRDNGFPFLTDAERQQLSGRVLLLTHGVFSSLAGAFNDIADPAGPVLQHLRGVYGKNIIGWDHRTIARTPLENAHDLLAALPQNMQPPDIVCHSRGALVTRGMLEHPSLEASRKSCFDKVGKAIFIAGATQGSQLASEAHINRLLNIYSAVGSIRILGSAGVVLSVIVGLLKVFAHGAARMPSIKALSSDIAENTFLQELNQELMTPTGEIVVAHANYDPSQGPLARFLDLNVDTVFGTANDMVVPFTSAEVFDKWQQVGTNVRFGTASQTQPVVMHTNFFSQQDIQHLLQAELI
jgi:hypothetical protein